MYMYVYVCIHCIYFVNTLYILYTLFIYTFFTTNISFTINNDSNIMAPNEWIF